MKIRDIILQLKAETAAELTENILPFWMERVVDEENGGFYGRITGNNELVKEAEKGVVLNARILWTFAASYRVLKDPAYLKMALRAKEFLINRFYDSEYGGVYWSLDCNGNPLDTKKQIYAQGFAIYGLAEYYRATGDRDALEYAIRLFEAIEQYSFDSDFNGYGEAFTRDWKAIGDMRLSSKDKNERKTMNTHLHILEPYTCLYRVWKDERLQKQLANLIELFLNRILDEQTGHLNLFFDNEWVNKYHITSFGHDIEASWLLHEAALVLDDKLLLERTEPIVEFIAAAAEEGMTADGGMNYEYLSDKKQMDTDRHWWVQAENVVGHFNLYQYFGDEVALEKAYRSWNFIKNNLCDPVNKEWYWSVTDKGDVNMHDDKAGFWKCPYHNGRMCLEIIERQLIPNNSQNETITSSLCTAYNLSER